MFRIIALLQLATDPPQTQTNATKHTYNSPATFQFHKSVLPLEKPTKYPPSRKRLCIGDSCCAERSAPLVVNLAEKLLS
jgi:hypothetical protein